jgi:uncharacterized protein (TIGR03435 family)
MTLTRKNAAIGGSLLALIAAAIVVKLLFFPSLKDANFATETRSLQQAPPGLVMIRKTHFAFLPGSATFFASPPHHTGKGSWIMGRNASLRTVVSAAFSQIPSHVAMPPNAPSGNFDFLITTADKQAEELQTLIRKKFGYTAHKETRQTDVLALKVTNPRLPGLTLSGADDKPNNNVLDYEIRFTHRQVAIIARLLDQNLPTPVVNETGLTNAYNFSIKWNSRLQQQLQTGSMDRATINQMLASLGLSLEPETAPMEMLVVEKAPR